MEIGRIQGRRHSGLRPELKRIVHVICKFDRDAWAGAETAILETCKHLNANGFRAEVYTVQTLSRIRAECIDGISVRRFWGTNPRDWLRPAEERCDRRLTAARVSPGLLASLLARRDVDLVHLHVHNKLSTSVSLICRARQIPYVYTIHSRYAPSPIGQSKYRWLSYDESVRRSKRIFAVAAEQFEALRRLYPERTPDIALIPNGVNKDLFSSGNAERFRLKYEIPPESNILLQVGSIYECKNQLYSLDLFSNLLEHRPQSFLVFIGRVLDSQYYNSLQRRIKLSNLQNRIVVIPGLTRNSTTLIDAYAAADLLLFPSKHEAHPLVLLEAWAAGLPVLASNIASFNAMITPGRTGEILPRKDDLRAASYLAARMLQNKHCYTSHVNEAAGKYSWSTTASRLIRHYVAILGTN